MFPRYAARHLLKRVSGVRVKWLREKVGDEGGAIVRLDEGLQRGG